MKCTYLLLVIATVFLVSCQTLPVINPPSLPAAQKRFTCPFPFLKEKYQLIHAIEIRAAGNTQGAIIGITVADPSNRFVSSAIMTAEGMVLFEAQSDAKGLNVHRALPPFDSGDFAGNMIDDIKLIFFTPQGLLKEKGSLPDGSVACRWQVQNGDFIDVIATTPESIEIKKYSECGSLKRHIKIRETSGNAYASIELQGNEIVNYRLLMTLLEARPAEGELMGKGKSKAKNDAKSNRR
jgi:hypothetical protein